MRGTLLRMSGPFSTEFPYPSQRMPVLARNVVATSQPLAAQAGLRVMLAGGNAIDGAIAAAITLTVVEPTSNGIGGDLFAIVWADGQLHGLNSSGRSPAALDPSAFDGQDRMPTHGWAPVTVPGAVAGWVALSERFGKLPFADLFSAAISYAADGYPLSPITAAAWQRAAQGPLKDQPDFVRDFTDHGRAPEAGEIVTLQDHARTLRLIADSAGREFYEGGLAREMADHAGATGGWLSEADLAAHRAEWVDTVSLEYRGSELHEIPPNGQGVAALIALGILKHTSISDYGPDSAEALHLQIEAMKLAFVDAHRYVADPEHMSVTSEALLDPEYLRQRAGLIEMNRAQDFGHGRPPGSGTVYLGSADAEGNMVSLIQSNYMGFGSGIVVPGTGISMQNRGAGFSLEEGHANRVAPGKRPFHTIIPGFLTRDGQPEMSFGVMGGPMQPQGHLQVVLRMKLWGQNAQVASDAPRWQVEQGLKVLLEDGMPDSVRAELARLGHEVASAEQGAFGGAQLIQRLPDGHYLAASDHRKDGQAVGW